jgi:AAA+ superfamily predicted ATPase
VPAPPAVVAALSAAVAAAPEDVSLRLHLARVLVEGDEPAAALEHLAAVLAAAPAHLEALTLAGAAAEAAGETERAAGYRLLLAALGNAPAPAGPPHRKKPDPYDLRALQNLPPGGASPSDGGALPVEAEGCPDDDSPWEVERPELRLEDVVGLEAVKRRLELAFLGPLRNPELMRMYRKSARGGLMLYGPPGCGKTFLARAVAGELGAKFLSVGLSDVLDMWLGESERKLRGIFDTARRNAPCVLFFDELDALGQKRSQMKHHGGRSVVNQLLNEMDSVDASNEGLFVLAATNHPWDVDTALRRPGRLDRMMLVLPPDAPAREGILRYHLRERPTQNLDLGWIAARTEEYSGADLAHLCEGATELALEASLRAGAPRALTMDDFRRVLKEVRPTTRAWFEMARNYALFANDGGVYDDLLDYVKARRIG